MFLLCCPSFRRYTPKSSSSSSSVAAVTFDFSVYFAFLGGPREHCVLQAFLLCLLFLIKIQSGSTNCSLHSINMRVKDRFHQRGCVMDQVCLCSHPMTVLNLSCSQRSNNLYFVFSSSVSWPHFMFKSVSSAFSWIVWSSDLLPPQSIKCSSACPALKIALETDENYPPASTTAAIGCGVLSADSRLMSRTLWPCCLQDLL